MLLRPGHSLIRMRCDYVFSKENPTKYIWFSTNYKRYVENKNEELHNLYSSPDIIRQVKENEVGGACGTKGRGEKSVQVFGGKTRRDHLEDQGVDGRMGSECILGRLAWGVWIGFDWLRTGTGGGLL
jgi:hypothetical protein